MLDNFFSICAPKSTSLHENFTVIFISQFFWGKIAFRSILISWFRQNYEFRGILISRFEQKYEFRGVSRSQEKLNLVQYSPFPS